MKHTIEIDCPPEILMVLHLDAKKFADLVVNDGQEPLFFDGEQR